MSNNSSVRKLGEIIENNEFLIPLYQRTYKWNSAQAQKLAEDIYKCHKDNPNGNKSLGLITLYKDKGTNDNRYYIIDGQQRFITLSIILYLLDNNDESISLHFERDNYDNKRLNAIKGFTKNEGICPDVDRIVRNRVAIETKISLNTMSTKEKVALKDFILGHIELLYNQTNELPIQEFMNLNAYKTAFSVSDHIRANLISLNSFYKEDLMSDKYTPILAKNLSNHSYKTAIALLYNNIQNKLYWTHDSGHTDNAVYKSIYELLSKPEIIIDPEKWNESHINILFGSLLKVKPENYYSGEIPEELNYWINMLQKLAYVNKLLDELKDELTQNEFHSFKQIDNYQTTTKKSFIREVFDGISNFDLEPDVKNLAKEIQKYSNIDSVLIRYLKLDSQRLANQYLEAFVYSNVNDKINKQADSKSNDKIELPQMSMDETIEDINECGRYIIDRYESEHRKDLNINISIPPIINLNDCENIDFGGSLDCFNSGTDTISAGKLFEYNIKIPVIQRDYCMGAKITGKNDFLAFLLEGFSNNQENLTISTIVIAVSKDNNDIYIFDGQQRSFTLYNILQFCLGNNNMKGYDFIGRDSKQNSQTPLSGGSLYAQAAVDHLKDVLGILKEKKTEFADYIKNKVYFKVKLVNNVSGAEQFFMDINGGVPLEKYEIYKTILCDKLSQLGKEDIVKKIENVWLDFFYNYRKNNLNVNDVETDESTDVPQDEEEVLEIRFIEHVCRFIMKPKVNNDSGVNLIFDEIPSKSELVSKLKYIEHLSNEDVDKLSSIMDAVCEAPNSPKESSLDFQLSEEDDYFIRTSSNGKIPKIFIAKATGKLKKEELLSEKEAAYINRFIWSLSQNGREHLKHYYKYAKYAAVSSLRKIYDNDQIIQDIFLSKIDPNSVKNDAYLYSDLSNKKVYIYGGYHNKEKSFDKIPEKEIPAYYLENINDITDKENRKEIEILRLQFLCEKAEEANLSKENKLYFALVENGIRYENDDFSRLLLLEDSIKYFKDHYDKDEFECFQFSTDQAWYKTSYLDKNSAYLFRGSALKYVNTKSIYI